MERFGLIAALTFTFLVILVGAIQDAKNVRGTTIGLEPDIEETQFETPQPAPEPVPPA